MNVFNILKHLSGGYLIAMYAMNPQTLFGIASWRRAWKLFKNLMTENRYVFSLDYSFQLKQISYSVNR